MNSKKLFLSNKALREQLASTINAPWFQECVVYANSEMLESGKFNMDNLIGAQKLIQTMKEMCQDEPVVAAFPKPRTQHNLDNTRKPSDNPKTKE